MRMLSRNITASLFSLLTWSGERGRNKLPRVTFAVLGWGQPGRSVSGAAAPSSVLSAPSPAGRMLRAPKHFPGLALGRQPVPRGHPAGPCVP